MPLAASIDLEQAHNILLGWVHFWVNHRMPLEIWILASLILSSIAKIIKVKFPKPNDKASRIRGGQIVSPPTTKGMVREMIMRLIGLSLMTYLLGAAAGNGDMALIIGTGLSATVVTINGVVTGYALEDILELLMRNRRKPPKPKPRLKSRQKMYGELN